MSDIQFIPESRGWDNTDVEVGIKSNQVLNKIKNYKGNMNKPAIRLDSRKHSYAVIQDSPELSGGSNSVITVTVRFLVRSLHKTVNIIEKQLNGADGDWGMYITPDGKLSYYSENGGGDYHLSGGNINKNQWYYGTFVLDQPNNNLRLYLDGSLVAEDTATGLISADTTGNVYLGTRVYDNDPSEDRSSDIFIENIKIWDKALSSSEIQEDNGALLTGNETNLVSYYKIDEKYGPTIYDSSGNNNGQLFNIDWVDLSLINNYNDLTVDQNGLKINNISWYDDFSRNSVNDYTWTVVDTNAPENSYIYDAANDWVSILTGNNDNTNFEWDVDCKENGYGRIEFIKRKDYPGDNNQAIILSDSNNNYYTFRWVGSAYTSQSVAKHINGTQVDYKNETGTVDSDASHTIEFWWSPTNLKLVVDGSVRFNTTTTDSTAIKPTHIKFTNGQIDLDLQKIIIKSSKSEYVQEFSPINLVDSESHIESLYNEYQKRDGLVLDGISTWADIGDLGKHQEVTFSFYIKKHTDKTGYLLDGRGVGNWWFLSHYNGYDINFHNKARWKGLELEKWYHVTLTVSANESKLYINGELVSTGDGLAIDLSSVRIGTRYTNSGYIKASMSSLLIYSRVLSEHEIKEIFKGSKISKVGLLRDYKMDEGQGSTLKDYANNKNIEVISPDWISSSIEYSLDGGLSWEELKNKKYLNNIDSSDSFLLTRCKLKTTNPLSSPSVKNIFTEAEISIKKKWYKESSTPNSWDNFKKIKNNYNLTEDFKEGELVNLLTDDGLELWKPELYAGFDENLNLKDRYDNFIAPKTNSNNTLKYFDGKKGSAVAVEEGTTNLLSEPLNPDTWSHLTNTDYGFISDKVIHVKEFNATGYRRTATGTDYRATRFDIHWNTTPSLSSPLTTSIWVRCLNPGPSTTVNLNYQGTDANGDRIDTSDVTEINDSNWHRLYTTRTLADEGFVSILNRMKFYLRNNSDATTWEVVMPQVEQKPFPTSFTETNRPNGELAYDLNLDTNEFVIGFWMNKAGVAGGWTGQSRDFRINYSNGRYIYWQRRGGAYGDGGWNVRDSATEADIFSYQINPNRNEYNFYVFMLENDMLSLFVNGEKKAEGSFIINSTIDNLTIFGANNCSSRFFDELVILPYAISEEKINDMYNQALPLEKSSTGRRQSQINLENIENIEYGFINWDEKKGLITNGENQYIDLGTPAELELSNNHPFTWEGWVYFRSFSVRDMLVCKNNGRDNSPYDYLLGSKENNAQLGAYDGSTWREINYSLPKNQWVHLAFSYDGTTMSFIVDGSKVGEVPFSWSLNTSHNIKIGGYSVNKDIDGAYYNVRMWNYGRTEHQINNDKDKYLKNTENGLLAQYKLNEAEGSIAYDSIGNNNGNIINSPKWMKTKIESSIDSGNTWKPCSNGYAISNLAGNKNEILLRETLETEDTSISPRIENLSINVIPFENQTEDGEWYLHIKYFDSENNIVTDYSGLYQIDKSPPDITGQNLSIDSPSGIYDTYTATVSWNINDNATGVEKSKLGFYLDGNWYYQNNNLPYNINTDKDIENITGEGLKTVTFSNIPRESNIKVSWQGFDNLNNISPEIQSSTIFTPRIIETLSVFAPSSYGFGYSRPSLNVGTSYEIGFKKNNFFTSNYTIDVLSKNTKIPTKYQVGEIIDLVKAGSLYDVGISGSDVGPTEFIIVVFPERPAIIRDGKFNYAARLGQADVQVDISGFNNWSLSVYQRNLWAKNFNHFIFLDNGSVFVNGQINDGYETGWFEHDSINKTLTIKKDAMDIDELLVFPKTLNLEEIKNYTNSSFYDPNRGVQTKKTKNVYMKIL